MNKEKIDFVHPKFNKKNSICTFFLLFLSSFVPYKAVDIKCLIATSVCIIGPAPGTKWMRSIIYKYTVLL